MKAALLLFFTLLALAPPANAQISKPDTLAETLSLLAQAFRDTPEIQAVTVNASDMSLSLSMPDGTDMTSFPDNLHSLLQAAESNADRQEILDRFIHNLVTGFASTGTPVNPRNIFPVIRTQGYGEGLGEGTRPYSEPFIKGLRIFFVEDLPTSLRFINTDQALTLSASGNPLRPLAIGRSQLPAKQHPL